MIKYVVLLLVVLTAPAMAATPVQLTPAQQQAIMDSGTQFGQGALSVGAGAINSAGGTAGVPNYNTTPSGQSPGSAGLFGPATAKQVACTGYTAPPGANQVTNQQDCDAVEFLTKHPNPKAAYSINPKTDPTIMAGKAVLDAARNGTAFDAGGVAAGGASITSINSAGVTSTTTQTGCQTTPETPAVTTTELCYVALTSNTQSCDKTMNCMVTQPAPVPAMPSYSCPTGSVLIGTQCQSAQIAATVNYSCSVGSALIGTECQPAPTTATLSYSCVSGTLSGTSCIQPAISATLTYSCPAGSSLSGTSCIPATINASVTYSCSAGSTLSGTSCQAPAYQPPGVAATATQTYPVCPTGTTTLTDTPTGITYTICNSTGGANGCPSGFINNYTLASGPCVLTFATYSNITPAPQAAPAGTTYRGYNVTYIPVYYVASIYSVNPVVQYTCPSGYTLSGTTCYPPLVIPPSTSATVTYSCPANYTLSGTTCIAPSTSATPNYSCPVNYTLSGASCVTPSTAATASYSCPVGTLTGTNCYPPPVGATVSYTCPAGSALTGTSCQPPNTTAAVNYSCGPGMVLSGSNCILDPYATCTWNDGCVALQAKTL